MASYRVRSIVPPPPPKRLLASIHDVSPRFEGAVDRLRDRLHVRLGDPSPGAMRLAMFVVPDFWDEAPLAAAPAFCARLRGWADQGVEMLLHGWNHRDDTAHAGRLAAFKARRMTAGEGEFLGLDQAQARSRLLRGRNLLEDILGRPVTGFVAPAWLYGDGARAALADLGFRVAEDHVRAWNPATGRVLCRGPAITWASRSAPRIASSLAFAAAARHLLAPLSVVRVGVHPGDVGVPAILRSIDTTIAALRIAREPGRYGDLQEEGTAPVPQAA